jgi:hypothetical protein
MRILRPAVPIVAVVALFALAACGPSAPTPSPTATGPSESPTPTPTSTPSSSAAPGEIEVTAAVVVMTASTLSVFGTDGSTLASVNYEMDAAAAVAEIAEALDEDPVVTPIPGEVGGPCPPATSYEFGGLQLRSPSSLGAVGSYEAIVTAATTSSGIGVETIAGQQIGAAQPAFQGAIGEFLVLYDDPSRLGFDILNPEAGPYDRIGAYAEFSGGTLVYLAAPNRLGFVGGCA